MLPPVSMQNVCKAASEIRIFPSFNTASIDVRRVLVPFISWVANAKAVGVRQRRVELDILQDILDLTIHGAGRHIVQIIQPNGG